MQAIKEFFTFVPMTELPKWLDPAEETANAITHLIGAILSIVGTVFLVIHSVKIHDPLYISGCLIFGVSMMVLYWISTLYHWVRNEKAKYVLRYGDHCSIYILIAGTYTPLCLVTLKGVTGFVVLGLIWLIAAIGITIKVLHFDGFFKITVLFYVAMGWMGVFVLKDLIKAFTDRGLYWLVIGGVFYTMGTYFFSKDEKVPFFHAIWHLYVLAGSFCHYIVVYYYAY